jgi:hypothetical protein
MFLTAGHLSPASQDQRRRQRGGAAGGAALQHQAPARLPAAGGRAGTGASARGHRGEGAFAPLRAPGGWGSGPRIGLAPPSGLVCSPSSRGSPRPPLPNPAPPPRGRRPSRPPAQIPMFWRRALMGHPQLQEFLTDDDLAALSALKRVRGAVGCGVGGCRVRCGVGGPRRAAWGAGARAPWRGVGCHRPTGPAVGSSGCAGSWHAGGFAIECSRPPLQTSKLEYGTNEKPNSLRPKQTEPNQTREQASKQPNTTPPGGCGGRRRHQERLHHHLCLRRRKQRPLQQRGGGGPRGFAGTGRGAGCLLVVVGPGTLLIGGRFL